jgi:ring-1,2-phenylacetyl-CoA epoxidase subunit PaaC
MQLNRNRALLTASQTQGDPLDELKSALSSYLLGLGDDELILGHRASEWCGYAPILEEDIAFANIALDEIGHAAIWYSLLAELEDKDIQRYTDRLVYLRPVQDYRNILMVELPNGDWAFSILRQYLFDTAEAVRLDALQASAYVPVGDAAAKMKVEEIYHQRHTRAWVQRLGLGTQESNLRMQTALEELWPYTAQLFTDGLESPHLIESGWVLDPVVQRAEWEGKVIPYLRECGLTPPAVDLPGLTRRDHTPHLSVLLEDMQSVARLDPGGEW